MIRYRFIIGVLLVVMVCPSLSFSQDRKKKSTTTEEAELETLHKLVEDQSKQIEALTEQVSHLTQLIEASRAAAAAATPVPAPPVVRPPAVQESTAPVSVATSGTVPADAAGTHVVTKGETLTSIAKHYKLTVGDLLKVNKIANDRMLQIGQTLVIPSPTPVENPQDKKESP